MTFEDRGGGQPYATNIVCVNVDRLEQFANDAGPEFFEGRRTVGYWWWEAGLLPEHLRPSLDVVDEVWVGSDYVQLTDRSCDREASAGHACAHPPAIAAEPAAR